jgi:hypothetical protein
MHSGDGRALGIVGRRYAAWTSGPTVERILLLLHNAGFNVALVR